MDPSPALVLTRPAAPMASAASVDVEVVTLGGDVLRRFRAEGATLAEEVRGMCADAASGGESDLQLVLGAHFWEDGVTLEEAIASAGAVAEVVRVTAVHSRCVRVGALVAGLRGQLRLVDILGEEADREFDGAAAPDITCVRSDWPSRRVAAASSDGAVLLWGTARGRPILRLTREGGQL